MRIEGKGDCEGSEEVVCVLRGFSEVEQNGTMITHLDEGPTSPSRLHEVGVRSGHHELRVCGVIGLGI